MLAARDQENLVHGHQAAAAAKPLNHGLRQLPPKTPRNRGPRTPFRVPLNDENAPLGFGAGKTGLKTVRKVNNENVVTVGKKGALGDKDKNAFVTPLGPRNRAPLGMKTTNAKAKVYQTPAHPLKDESAKPSQKSTIAPNRKVQIAHTKLDVLHDDEGAGEPDIEYAPPPPKPLPDYPDDWPHDREYPMFEGENLTRGWAELHAEPVGKDGLTAPERKMKEEQEKFDKEFDAMILKDVQNLKIAKDDQEFIDNEIRQEDIVKKSKTASKKPLIHKGSPSMTTSKRAAAALMPPKPSSVVAKPKAHFAATTKATKTRIPSTLIRRGRQTPPPTNPSSMRYTAATAASRTTLGYSKGRATSSTYKSLSGAFNKPNENKAEAEDPSSLAPAMYMKKYGKPKPLTDMWNRCRVMGLLDDNKDDKELTVEELLGSPEENLVNDEALDDFEMPMPT
ncbi:MAG: hypothetical protein M1834_006233 [Cirrosporium novae-zelandiae]|nr:MAG: hypothetical protein M1834_006233 [Cirrosporium novae-zelandiae]